MTKINKHSSIYLKLISLLILCGGLIFLLVGCTKKLQETVTTDFIMDTFIEYKFYGENSDLAVKECSDKLREFEDNFSAHKDNSYVSLINKNAGIKKTEVPSDVFNLIEKAYEYSKETKGNFDVTIAPLTFLWDITAENPKVPQEDKILQAKNLVNYENIELNKENNSVFLQNKGQAIDLGGIAKGEATRIIFETAKKYEIEFGYASVGGNLAVIGTSPKGDDYRFGIRDPLGEQNEFIGSLSLTGKTMSTTGGYERFFEQDGETYIHILDKKTGYPVKSDLLSVTVIGEDGAYCDMLSTAIFVGGKKELDYYLNKENTQIVAVDKDKNIYISKSLYDNFEINEKNGKYTLV